MLEDLASLGLEIGTDSLEVANRELQKLPAAAASAERSTRSLGDAAAAAQQAIDKATRHVTGMGNASTASAKQLDAVERAMDKARQQAEGYARLADRMGAAAGSSGDQVAKAGRNLGQYAADAAKAQEASTRLTAAMATETQQAKALGEAVERTTAARTRSRSLGQYGAITPPPAGAAFTVSPPQPSLADQKPTYMRASEAVSYLQANKVAVGPDERAVDAVRRHMAEAADGARKVKDEAAGIPPKLQQAAERATILEKSFATMYQHVQRVGMALAAYFTVRSIIQAADAYTELTNRLKTASLQGADLLNVQSKLFDVAGRNGVEVNALAEVYARASMASGELGASQEDILKVTSGVAAALRLQGTSTQAARGALLQLSQAMGTGKVRAEEFNSIIGGAYPIAMAAAQGMDGMGGSVTKLRMAIINGEVSSKRFFDALMKGLPEIEAKAAAVQLTLSGAFTAVKNGFIDVVGSTDRATGVSTALAEALAWLAKMFRDVAVSAKIDDTWVQDISRFVRWTREAIDWTGELIEKFDEWGKSSSIKDWVTENAAVFGDMVRDMTAGLVRFVAVVTEIFKSLIPGMKAIFRDAINGVLEVLEDGLGRIGAGLKDSTLGKFLTTAGKVGAHLPAIGPLAALGGVLANGGGNVRLGRLDGPTLSQVQTNAAINIGQAGQNAQDEYLATNPSYVEMARQEKLRREALNRQAGMDRDERRARYGGLPTSAPPGGGQPPTTAPTKGEQDAAKRYEELVQQLNLASEAQQRMTESAAAGNQAFEVMKAEIDAQNRLFDVFKQRLSDSDPRLRAVRDLLIDIAQGKAKEAFATTTTELKKQNEVLEAQIALMEQAPEVQAREIAVLRAKQELEKAGVDKSTEAYRKLFDERAAAIEQNVVLTRQQQELQRAQELWIEPLRQGLRNIQDAAANAWESVFETGKLSFESLSQVFTKTIRRMAAEFLALATIRPVMSVLVQAVGATGILPQSAVSSMGYGGSLGSSPISGMPSVGGGGLGGLFGGGGGFLGGIGDWLNTPFTGPYAGVSPSAMAGVPTLSPSLMSPSSWGITPMMGLGAAAGVGGGIYQLLSGGGSTGSTIGGIASIAGGLASLIPGVGPFLGPLLAIGGNLLGGLFGQREPTITNQAYGQLSYGAGGFGTSGGAWGPSANAGSLTGPLGQQGASIQSIFDALGGVQDPGKVWGLAVQSFSQQYGKNGSFQNQTSFLVDPSGNRTQWGMGSTAQDVGIEAASAQVAIRSIVDGAVGVISEAMRTALTTVGQRQGGGSLAEVGQAITFVQAYDQLGQSVTAAEKALKAITDGFGEMKDNATALGLSLAPITAEMEKQRQQVATDFADTLGRELDPAAYARKDLEKWRETMIEENRYLLDNVTGALDQINKIEEVYAKRRAAIVEQNAAALQSTIERLMPGGDLANVDPTAQLAGLKASYSAAYAQAAASPTDQTLVSRFSTGAASYAEYAQRYFAGSDEYTRIRNEIIANLQSVQGAAASGSTTTSPTTGANDAGYSALVTQMQQLLATVGTLTAQLERERTDNAELRGLLKRFVTNQAA